MASSELLHRAISFVDGIPVIARAGKIGIRKSGAWRPPVPATLPV